jgi:hypothetical protein
MIKGGSVLQRSTIDVKWRKRLSSLEVEVVGKVIKGLELCVSFGEALEAAESDDEPATKTYLRLNLASAKCAWSVASPPTSKEIRRTFPGQRPQPHDTFQPKPSCGRTGHGTVCSEILMFICKQRIMTLHQSSLLC